ncbi:OPT family oligopeptide transporter [bacterium]|nr:OPT family oligopeptide transporter [bacterium]
MSDDPNVQLYQPEPNERQLTWRAVLSGCLIGSVVSCTNIYVGLKIGWAFGASIISAVLSFSLFSVINGLFPDVRRLSTLETNIAQTAGSSAGYMSSAAGLLAPIPALMLLGVYFDWQTLLVWSVSVAFLGVFFAVPLRRQMIDVDNLKFPTGTATAATIMAMYGDARDAIAKARMLLISAIAAGIFKLAVHFVPQLESPPLHEWFDFQMFGVPVLATLAAWTFTVYLGPSLLGAGFLIGPRVVLSLLLGAILSWGVLGPLSQQNGWAPGGVMSYADGPRGWLLWPGVALMVSEGLATLAFSWKTFVNALTMSTRMVQHAGEGDVAEEQSNNAIPNSWWIGGLIAGSLLTMLIAHSVFEIPWYLTILAIVLSAILSIVAVRSVGETDINPIGGMGKVTQLAFGWAAPNMMSTNLLAAAITSGGASQAADMMQDLKTGKLLGASPRKQFFAQLAGICVGILFAIPVFYLFTTAYELGSEELPAPAALAWKAMAELLNQGPEALPPFAIQAIVIASIAGFVLAGLQRISAIKSYVPSGLALGIAFIIPAFYSLVMFYGLVVWLIWRAISPGSADKFTYAVASGLIAGEGLMGIVNAILTLMDI